MDAGKLSAGTDCLKWWVKVIVRSKIIEARLLIGTRLLNGRPRIRVLIKILKICVARQLGHPWWLNFLLSDHGPVHAAEPGVLLHIVCAVHHASEPLAQVLLEQARDQLAHVDGDLRREVEKAHCDPPVHLVRVLVVERRVACEHFEYEDAESPPVHAMIVTY